MQNLSKACFIFFLCIILGSEVIASAEDTPTLALQPAAAEGNSDSGKPATVNDKAFQTSRIGAAAAQPLLPERPADFNPMTQPLPQETDGIYPQTASTTAGISSLYMAQLASYIGQLALFTRCLLAGMIVLIILLFAAVIILRGALRQTRQSADAAMMSAEEAKKGIAVLRRILHANLAVQAGGDAVEGDL